MSYPVELRLIMTDARLAEITAEAERRGMTPMSLVNAVVKDWLRALEARTGDDHRHCPCRDRTPGGLARCCYCDQWCELRLSGTRFVA